MIRSAIGAELQNLIDYLNEHYPTEKDPKAMTREEIEEV